MKLCKVDELTGQETLAKDIFTIEYKVLLSEGTVLKQEYIKKLKELDIRQVYIKDDQPDTKTVMILKMWKRHLNQRLRVFWKNIPTVIIINW